MVNPEKKDQTSIEPEIKKQDNRSRILLANIIPRWVSNFKQGIFTTTPESRREYLANAGGHEDSKTTYAQKPRQVA